MPTVELIYDSDCPNVEAARTQFLKAFSQLGMTPKWQEWERSAPESPEYTRNYGSPTILVNGKDITGVHSQQETTSCRVYTDKHGDMGGVPPIDMIVQALQETQLHPKTGSKKLVSLGVLPGIGIAFLPKLICPVCWPAYAALVSALGLGFLMDTVYLLPLTLFFLGLALFALAFRAKSRQGYGPFCLGLVASSFIVLGKFVFGMSTILYASIFLLTGAAIWNIWPKRNNPSLSCPSCVSDES